MTTYLLGAGASAYCIPIVEEFHETYRSILNIQLLRSGRIIPTLTELSGAFKGYLRSYYPTLKPHPTIDIFAKKLFLKKEDANLLLLKKLLIVLYNFIQYSKPIDERYIKFFASILQTKESENIIPEEVNIITWNYDMQLELAYSDFIKEEDIHLEKIHKSLRIFPSPFYYYQRYEENNRFTITRLNGSACLGYIKGGTTNSKEKEIDILFKPKSINFEEISSVKSKVWTIDENILKTISQYERAFENDIKLNKIYIDFTYCWERKKLAIASYMRVLNLIKNTTDLIIIGYSFPYVNREIDDNIFRNLLSIKRIIIQDPMEDERFNFIKDRINKLLKDRKGTKYLSKITIQHIKDTREFYLP